MARMAVTFWQTRATYGPYSAHVPTLGPHFPPITPSIAAPSQIEATHTHPPHRTALPIGYSAKKPGLVGVFFGLLFQTGHCYTPPSSPLNPPSLNPFLITARLTPKEPLPTMVTLENGSIVTLKDTNFPRNIFEWKPLNPILHGHI